MGNLDWREIGSASPEWFEERCNDGVTIRGWVRTFAAPFTDGTWAYAQGWWYPCDHGPHVDRNISYIWCRDPYRPYDTDMLSESDATSWYRYDGPPTWEHARHLCVAFDPKRIRWRYPGLLIGRDDDSLGPVGADRIVQQINHLQHEDTE